MAASAAPGATRAAGPRCADGRFLDTIANLRQDPALEINVVDTTLRKGYRFKGTATIIVDSPQFEQMVVFYRQRGTGQPHPAYRPGAGRARPAADLARL
jgi:hypothetical protein